MKIGKLIGIGNTAEVFEWDDKKVLKLFYKAYPTESVEMEYRNAMAIREMNFLKPKAYELITQDGRTGIIYDKIEGVSLLEDVLKTGDIQKCAEYLAKIHKEINCNMISGVESYKDFLKYHISKAAISLEEQKEVLQRVNELPEGNTLCHGDFHPGNVLISGEAGYVIDFMNICYGDPLYDIARTVFLIEYTPVPAEAENKELLLQLKKGLADAYLKKMDVTREMIADYLSVVVVARKGECPEE